MELQLSNRTKKSVFEITEGLRTPVMVIDLEQVQSDLNLLKKHFSQYRIYYAVKSNPDPMVIQQVKNCGVGFEVASIQETTTVLQAGVSSHQIVCFHPIKSPELIRYLFQHGIRTMAVDSLEEIDKLATYAPKSEVVIRFVVCNEGSIFPLNNKFGAEWHEIELLIAAIIKSGLKYAGLTIHVGSQCLILDTWKKAIDSVSALKDYLNAQGYRTELLSLGGGLPVSNDESAGVISQIAEIAFTRMPDCQSLDTATYSIEPGRAIVAKAGTIVATVQGIARRSRETWIYIDTGIYQGLFEAYQSNGGIVYPITVNNNKLEFERYTIGGPTCDSDDVIAVNLLMPKVEIGDRIAFHNTGAYTTCTATEFNGFNRPHTIYLYK